MYYCIKLYQIWCETSGESKESDAQEIFRVCID